MNIFFEEPSLKEILASRKTLSRSRSAEGKPLQRLMLAYTTLKGWLKKRNENKKNEKTGENYLNLQKKACFIDQEPDLNRMENLLSEGHGISLLYIFFGLGESEKHELQNFSFMGFDYGICESDSTLFSSIFNEVLFGVNDELRKVYEHLNSNLLFPNIDFAKKYVDIQRQLFKKEHDVESPSEMKVYDIWKRNIL